MKRLAIFLFGLASYAVFLATFLYAIGFIGNVWVPKAIDSPPQTPFLIALTTNLALLALFAIQHSVMARPAFKRWWTRIVPVAAERSAYVLLSSLALIVLFAFWQPIGGVVWDIASPVARTVTYGAFVLGWTLMLYATLLINHFDLFGLRQVTLHLLDRPYSAVPFGSPALYRYVRHPLYVGWLFIFWSAPTMTIAHLVFAAATTVYILIAIQFEEQDLLETHPEYAAYRKRVPMLIPFLKRRRSTRRALGAR
jgi:protein-S-isoprenylcysteine O-methyltransferase Ste14